ncbi:hypothetical protein [Kitasatospora sp. NPDC005748]|uniref:hypothetical protein n=1 Tax=Kitasatospora sp. NPDC005748 TaxID=3157063 RepID=UPI0034007DBF
MTTPHLFVVAGGLLVAGSGTILLALHPPTRRPTLSPWPILTACSTATLTGLWMLRNVHRATHRRQAYVPRDPAAVRADFAIIVRHLATTTATEPPLTRRGRRALARVGRTTP